MFWSKLPKPILILAPMEDVTDTVFRRIVASCAPPDVYFTEFTNVEGLLSRGSTIVAQRLQYTDVERPLVAQIWGNKPDAFYQVARMLVDRGFDGIDINMGCPVKDVVNQGSGGGLCETPDLAREIVAAVKRGVAETGKIIPISVKTRIGKNKIITEPWAEALLSCDIDALTVHGRTVKEQSAVPAHWDEIGKVVKLRDAMGKKTIIIGNGDVVDYADGLEKVKTYGVDGVMIGRGIFHNMWAFEKAMVSHTPTQAERFALMKKHVQLFDATWGKAKNFAILKKFFKIYIQGFDNAVDARVKFMEAKSSEEVLQLLLEYLPS